jgi:hypothetical protein
MNFSGLYVAVIVNSERYLQLLKNYFISQLVQNGVTGYFQQERGLVIQLELA